MIIDKSNDTICALATPSGGALGIIRISGPQALSIVDSLFYGRKKIIECPPRTVHYGVLRNKVGELLDEVVVSVYKGPNSYTGEDAVEITCHGSAFILEQTIHALIDAGCRQAAPGEYTQRAFLNGKLDLSQAEAVADLIASTNQASHHAALSQLRGHFSSKLSLLRDELLRLTSLLELELDFSEHEDLEFADRSELKVLSENIDKQLVSLSDSFKSGQAIKNGIPVAIVGKTNVGKSTLLNKLLRDEKAIVSPIHGTTRDSIEDVISIHGLSFRFIDTAGIRSTTDYVEQIGIERTYEKMTKASIVLWLFDETPTAKDVDDMQRRCEGKELIAVRTKIDLLSINTGNIGILDMNTMGLSLPKNIHTLCISAKDNYGIDALEELLYSLSGIPKLSENDVIVTSARHYNALLTAHNNMRRVLDALEASIPSDLVAEELHIVLENLAEITGNAITPTETLNNIFKNFCIGK